MFYRQFRTDTNDDPDGVEGPFGFFSRFDNMELRRSGRYPHKLSIDYEGRMELIDEVQHCQVFRAPEVGEDMWKAHGVLRFPENRGAFPDVFADCPILVSEKYRAVVSEIDPFPHQFFPAPITDKHDNQLDMKQDYYWMYIRRVVKIEDTGSEPPGLFLPGIDFAPGPYVRPALATIQAYPEVRALVEKFPIWALDWGHGADFYLNETMVTALRKVGIAGMNEITEEKRPEENLWHV